MQDGAHGHPRLFHQVDKGLPVRSAGPRPLGHCKIALPSLLGGTPAGQRPDWLIYVKDIDEGMPKQISRSLFTDDVALLACARTPGQCDTLKKIVLGGQIQCEKSSIQKRLYKKTTSTRLRPHTNQDARLCLTSLRRPLTHYSTKTPSHHDQ